MRLLLSLLIVSATGSAAKVAIFIASLSKSQVVFNLRLAEQIAKDHDVVLIRPSFNPDADKLTSHNPRIRDYRPKGCDVETFAAFYEAENAWVWEELSMADASKLTTLYRNVVFETCKRLVSNDEFLDWMRAEHFDLALHHHLDTCTIGIIRAVGIPQWGWVLSTPLYRSMMNLVGVPALPSYIPSLLTDGSNEMPFFKRMKNFAWEMFCDVFMSLGARPYTQLYREKFGDDFPSLDALAREGRFLMVNVHADIEFAIPVTSKVVHIGGLGMDSQRAPLKEPFASFVNNSQKAVLVSFGSVADTKHMPASIIQAFLALFKANPQLNFIWKFSEDIEVPSNVLKAEWLPQHDLLGNDNIVAFITHGGYNSIGEAINSATPILAVPLFADQFRNAQMAEHRKFGLRLYKNEINAHNLNATLHKIINDERMYSSARELQSIARSPLVAPGEAIRHAINFTLSHPSYDREVPKLSLISLYSIDMICLLFILPGLLVLLFLNKLLKFFWPSRKQKTE